MDWSRAKTILIIAFLCLDLFLAARLWLEPGALGAKQPEVTTLEVEQAVAELAGRGISVQAAIPRRCPAMSLLDVAPAPLDKSGEASAFLHPYAAAGPVRSETIPGGTAYSRGAATLTIRDTGTLEFALPAEIPPAGATQDVWDILRAREAAGAFIDEHGGLPSGARLDVALYDAARDVFSIEFVETHADLPVFSARLKVDVAHWGVVRFYRSWVDVRGSGSQPRRVVAATEALRRWADARRRPATGEMTGDRSPADIVDDVSLGYFGQEHDAESWQVVPVWRVRTADGRSYYINAWTGEPERVK